MDLTVIVPVFNGAATLDEQLDALATQRWAGRWEVLVVDNASTDATPAIVASRVASDDRFRTIRADAAHNLAYVRNAGVRATGARSVA